MRKYLLVTAFVLWSLWPLCARNTPSEADPNYQQQLQAGHDALAAGKFKDALEIFKKLNKLQNNSCPTCYINMAAAYQRMGDFKNAVASCDRALAVADTDSTRAAAHSMKGTAILSRKGADGKDLKDGEAEYRAALALVNNEPVFHFNLATTLLRQSRDEEGKEELNKCLALHPEQSVANQARKLIADPRRAREDFAPDFHITTLQGQDISLQQLQGNIVVLDFWATWCPPCRASIPELKELTRKYANARVVLISVSADEDEKAWREFVASKKMDWPQYRDANERVEHTFAVHSFPTYLVIDGDGIIRQRITGMNPQESVVHRLKATLQAMPQLEGVASR
jgi:peroxiredoxin/Flp pilus assembly protein TadD